MKPHTPLLSLIDQATQVSSYNKGTTATIQPKPIVLYPFLQKKGQETSKSPNKPKKHPCVKKKSSLISWNSAKDKELRECSFKRIIITKPSNKNININNNGIGNDVVETTSAIKNEKRVLVHFDNEKLKGSCNLSRDLKEMGDCKQNFAKAQMGARRLYLDREDKDLFSRPVNGEYNRCSIRHLLRFVGTKESIPLPQLATCDPTPTPTPTTAPAPTPTPTTPATNLTLTTTTITTTQQQQHIMEEDTMTRRINTAFFESSVTPVPCFYIHGAENILCSIMEEARNANEWWVYIHTPRVVNTRRICDALYSMWNLKGTFFTDEYPEGMRTKRHAFVLLQHFRYRLNQIHSTGISGGGSSSSSSNF